MALANLYTKDTPGFGVTPEASARPDLRAIPLDDGRTASTARTDAAVQPIRRMA
jgi:hypothetical protein